MKKQSNARLGDVTREESANRVNKFADSLLPSPPLPKVEPEVRSVDAGSSGDQPAVSSETTAEASPDSGLSGLPSVDGNEPSKADSKVRERSITKPAVSETDGSLKPERGRRSSSSLLDTVVNTPAPANKPVFNKMVRVVDDHHEMLRFLAFNHRTDMNLLVYNLLEMLHQAYKQHYQKGGTNDV